MNQSICRWLSTCSPQTGVNVSILGASGRLGHLVSLILKQSPRVNQLRLYDLPESEPIGVDLQHIDTKCEVFATQQANQLGTLLHGSDIVLITAGKPRKPSLSLGEMLRANAKIILELMHEVAVYCPKAMIGIITDPLHCILPIAGMTLRHLKVFNSKQLFGVSMINAIRASTIVAESLQINPSNVKVPVIGGTFGDTLVPLISQMEPNSEMIMSQEMIVYLTERIRQAPLNIVEAYKDKATGCLSSAYATAGFVHTLAGAMLNEVSPIVYVMIHQPEFENDSLPYLVTPVRLSQEGIEENFGIPDDLSVYEKDQLERALQKLIVQEKLGIDLGEKLIHHYSRRKLWPSINDLLPIESLKNKSVPQIENIVSAQEKKKKSLFNIQAEKEKTKNENLKRNPERKETSLESLNYSHLKNETRDPLIGNIFNEYPKKEGGNDLRTMERMMAKKFLLNSKIENK